MAEDIIPPTQEINPKVPPRVEPTGLPITAPVARPPVSEIPTPKISSPVVPKAEPPKVKQPIAQSGIPRIRTYASDMSKVIRSRGETLSSIVAAQQESQPREQTPTRPPLSRRTIFVLGGALLFVVLGIVLVGTVMVLTRTDEEAPSVSQSIIFPNKTVSVSILPEDELSEVLAVERTQATLSLGEIERIIVTQNGVALPPQELALRLGLPSALAREISDLMVGVHSFDRNQPFFILEVVTYDRSFNALLTWERDMGRSLGDFFRPVSTTSAAPNTVFTDEIIRNNDVRKSQALWPLLYTFPTRTTIIITTNEFTLREVITRLGSQNP